MNSFESGDIYISKSMKNIRGNGVYTTSNFKVTQYFSENKNYISKMFLDKNNSNILESSYFMGVMEIMVENHHNEFNYDDKDIIFDSMEKYYNKIEETSNFDEQKKLLKKLEQDTEFQELRKNRKYYYKDNKIAVLNNMGLLTLLMGYNVLHTDEIDTQINMNIEEYLILDSSLLQICHR